MGRDVIAEPGAGTRLLMNDAASDSTPIVSVVLSVYNTEAYLADSVSSILDQTFEYLELICVESLIGNKSGPTILTTAPKPTHSG
jgi:hypothetical protein